MQLRPLPLPTRITLRPRSLRPAPSLVPATTLSAPRTFRVLQGDPRHRLQVQPKRLAFHPQCHLVRPTLLRIAPTMTMMTTTMTRLVSSTLALPKAVKVAPPVTVSTALSGVTTSYRASNGFALPWAALAGLSAWESLVHATLQYLRVRMVVSALPLPADHASWAVAPTRTVSLPT